MRILEKTANVRLLSAISLRSPFGARDHALIRFDLLTGLRVGELVALDVGHVWRPEGGPRDWLDLPASACKGQRGRQIPLCLDAQQAVRDLVAFLRLRGFSTAAGAPLLTDRRHRRLAAREVQRAVQRYRERAGLDVRVTPHTLRHTFASRLVDAGVNPRAIQVLLGHECLSSTEVYLHNRPAALVEAVGRLSG